MTIASNTAAQEWRAHWPLVTSAMIGFSFFAVVTYTLGTFIEPLEKQFRWSRAEISFGLTIFGVIHALGSPLVGALLDRIGTRRVAIPAMIASGIAFAAFSMADGSLALWVWLWVVFSVCSLGIKSTIWSAGTSSVFSRSRGLALAAVLSGSAIGQSLSPLIANALIESQGWQNAYRWIGLCWAGLSTLLLIFFFHDVRALQQPAQTSPGVSAAALPGLTVRQAFCDRRVLRIGGANFIMSLVGSGVGVHMVPLITDTGLDRHAAVQIAAAAGIAGILGKFLTGWLLDRFQGNLVPFTSFAVASVGHLLLLNWLDNPNALPLGALCLGYSAGAGLQVSTYLVSRYVGLRNFGTIFGSISSAMMAGAAFGPVIAGKVFDLTGGYAPLLLLASPAMLICSFLFVGLGPYPTFNPADPSSISKPQGKALRNSDNRDR